MPALSPNFGLAMIVLHGADGDWPGLLLHSRALAWPFDEPQRLYDDDAQLAAAAARAGLHRVPDPFAADLPAARTLWVFQVPGRNHKARLSGLTGDVELARPPVISDEWWAAAVESGGTCRMLVAAGVNVDPGDPHFDPISAAAAAGRVFGAMIPVRFYPEEPR